MDCATLLLGLYQCTNSSFPFPKGTCLFTYTSRWVTVFCDTVTFRVGICAVRTRQPGVPTPPFPFP